MKIADFGQSFPSVVLRGREKKKETKRVLLLSRFNLFSVGKRKKKGILLLIGHG